MRNAATVLLVGLTLCFLLIGFDLQKVLAQGQSGRPWHVTLPAMPTGAATSPTALEGGALTSTTNVTMLTFTNKDAASQTITVQDCETPTAFVLYNAVTITAGQTWTVSLGGVSFVSCFKWTASSTNVTASATGTR